MSISKTKWGYRAEFMMKGKRIYAQGFFKKKSDAKQWIREEKERLKKELEENFSPNSSLSLWETSQSYLSDCEIRFSRKTLDEKRFCLQRFYKFCGNVEVSTIQPSVVLDFVNDRARTANNNSANKDRKNLKAFYAWIRGIYGVSHDPTAPIPKKPHTRKERRIIPLEEIFKVMDTAEGQDKVLLGAYWNTGARRNEIFRWKWAEDIDFNERRVRLGTKKNRGSSMSFAKLSMNDDLYELLSWQWNHRHPTSPFVFCHMDQNSKHYGEPFVARRKMLKGLCKKANVDPFGFHDIRHSVAKYLNGHQNVGLKKVQQVLRHKKQTTTEIYVAGNYVDTNAVMRLLEKKKVKKVISIEKESENMDGSKSDDT